MLIAVFRYSTDHTVSVVAALVGAGVIAILVADPFLRIARAQKVADILGREQEPFWLTSGASYIALSNLSVNSALGCAVVDARSNYLHLR